MDIYVDGQLLSLTEKMQEMRALYKSMTPELIKIDSWVTVDKSWEFMSQGMSSNPEKMVLVSRTLELLYRFELRKTYMSSLV